VDWDNIERIVIRPWFDRFNTLNKGVLRIVTLGLAINMGLMAIVLPQIFFGSYEGELAGLIVLVLVHFGVVIGLRVLLWVIDGFTAK